MAALLAFLLASASTGAAPAAAFPGAAGAPVRVSGSPTDRPLIEALERGYAGTQPAIRFDNMLHGPDSTLAGTYTGTVDIAFMARELREPMERMAYQWAMLQPPLLLHYAVGGINGVRLSTQIGIFVNAANPMASLTLAQLDAVLGAEHLRGPANARRWGDLGSDPGWAMRPIHVYGPAVDSVAALFVRRQVMQDSRKWNEGYREQPNARAALDRVARDPSGIAFAPVADRPPGVRLVALARDADEAAALPDRAGILTGTYPLVRWVDLVVAHGKGTPVPPAVARFAAYILSPAGQGIIGQIGPYLPLPDTAPSRRALEQAR